MRLSRLRTLPNPELAYRNGCRFGEVRRQPTLPSPPGCGIRNPIGSVGGGRPNDEKEEDASIGTNTLNYSS